MTSHYVPFFTQQVGRRLRAFCGVLVDPREHANEPTCPNCQHILELDTAQLARLQAEPPQNGQPS